jgi:hypothetical protein
MHAERLRKMRIYLIFVGNVKEIEHSKDLDLDGRNKVKWILDKLDGKMLTEFIWLRIGTDVELLRTR